MASVTIYTRDFCGYCARAKALLESKGVEFTEYNATAHPDYRKEMMDKSNRNTFPQIFIARSMSAAVTICTRWTATASWTRFWPTDIDKTTT